MWLAVSKLVSAAGIAIVVVTEVTMRWDGFDEPVQAVVADVGSWGPTYSWMSSVEAGRRSDG